MMSDWWGIVLVVGTLWTLMLAVKTAQHRFKFHPELARKTIHVGMGLVCLSFPWLFQAAFPVFVLAVLTTGLLAAVRWVPALRAGLGSVLSGVERDSLGEVYFPIAVAITFALAQGDRLLFTVPILVLTLADTMAALIGRRYGSRRYHTKEGAKSVQGSLAFSAVAFVSTQLSLLLFTNIEPLTALLPSLAVALLSTSLEAIAPRGTDNLIVPLGVVLLLRLWLAP